MADYIVHKAVELSKVRKARRLQLEQPGYIADNYIPQPKHDGCNAVVTLHHAPTDQVAWVAATTVSRTGEPNRAMGAAERTLRRLIAPGHVVLGEAWWPGADQFSTISGHFRRHEESDRLGLVAFDCLTIAEFEQGSSNVPYHARLRRLNPLRDCTYEQDRVQLIVSDDLGPLTPQEYCNELVDKGGYDGAIFRDPDGLWAVGGGTNGEIIKIKRKLSFDLRVTAVYEGLGKNAGRAGALGLDFRGQELKVNAGTDAQRHRWFDDPSTIIGKIVEVEAMDYSSDGLLREPRLKGIRDDKITPDA